MLLIFNQIATEINSIVKVLEVVEEGTTLKENEVEEGVSTTGLNANYVTLLDTQQIGVSIGLTRATLDQKTLQQEVLTTIILPLNQIRWLP